MATGFPFALHSATQPRPALASVPPTRCNKAYSPRSEEVIDVPEFLRALDAIANKESRFTDRFYETFFARWPDTRDLFGLHGIAERKEMMHETLRSLHALCEQEPWLEENLIAL